MNIPHCLPPRFYLSVFPNSQTTSFANLFYFCVVKGGLAVGTPFESDDNQFCQLLFDLAKSKVYWPPVLPAGGDHATHKCLCVGRPLALSRYPALPTTHNCLCVSRADALLRLVGSSGLEPPTSRLSGGCSNQLSYKPML